MQPLYADASSSGSCFANVTVVGVVDAPPEAVWPMISDPVNCGVFSDVKSSTELGRSNMRLHSGNLVSELEVEQVTAVHVLPRAAVDAPMRVKLECNHTAKEAKLQLLKGNMFLRDFEGLYAVLPLNDADGREKAVVLGELSPELLDALGPKCHKQLSSKLTLSSGSTAAKKLAEKQQLERDGQQRQLEQASRSLVILHQKMQPSMNPPPGMGGYVRGQVRKQFERMYDDIGKACEVIAARAATAVDEPRKNLLGLADKILTSPMPDPFLLGP